MTLAAIDASMTTWLVISTVLLSLRTLWAIFRDGQSFDYVVAMMAGASILGLAHALG